MEKTYQGISCHDFLYWLTCAAIIRLTIYIMINLGFLINFHRKLRLLRDFKESRTELASFIVETRSL